ncbi:BTB/POZ domain containing protein, partial [Aphelenchoides avenae]
MSIASGSFRAMFFGDFNRERVVEVPDASPDAFRALMKYVYTDEVEITEDNAESVIQLADKYLLAGLFGECVEWLKQMCWERVLRHGDDALNSEAFLSLPQDLLARIFASDQLAADEITVYRRAVDWAKRQLESVDVRASSLLDIDRVLQQLGAPRRGTCEHEQGVKTNLKELRKLCATTSIHCQRRHRWICLTCKE